MIKGFKRLDSQANLLQWARILIDDLFARFNEVESHIKFTYSGVGSPEGVVKAPPGALYSNTSGGVGTTLYVKESGTGTTGWAPK